MAFKVDFFGPMQTLLSNFHFMRYFFTTSVEKSVEAKK